MGQYYRPVILAEDYKDCKNEDKIVAWFNPHVFMEGAKLVEHYRVSNPLVCAVTKYLIENEGRLVWAGDYAELEPNSDDNLYDLTRGCENRLVQDEDYLKVTQYYYGIFNYKYFVNYDKKQYVEIGAFDNIHPMTLLCNEGNGRGNGDYFGTKGSSMIGVWARNMVGFTKEIPVGFHLLDIEFDCDFK